MTVAVTKGRFLTLSVFLLLVSTRTLAQTPTLSTETVAPLPMVTPAARLTLEQAKSLALSGNPQIHQSTQQVESAYANLKGQRAPLNGTFSYAGVNNTVTSTDVSNPSNYSVLLPVETSGRFHLRNNQAKAQWEAATHDRDTTSLTVTQSVTTSYIGLQVANAMFQSEQLSYDTAKQLLTLTSKQFEVGAVPETNVERSRIALLQETINLNKARTDVLTARVNLNTAIGRAPQTPVDVVDALESDQINVAVAHLPEVDTLQEIALEHRPELQSAQSSKQALSATTRLQRSQFLPDLYLERDLARNTRVEVGLGIPLFDFGSIRGSVQKAEADERVQDAQVEQVHQTIESDVRVAYLSLTNARNSVDNYKTAIVPQAEALLKQIQAGYALGANTLLEVLDAESTVRDARDGYFSALGDYRNAVAQLERAVGLPLASLPDVKTKTSLQTGSGDTK